MSRRSSSSNNPSRHDSLASSPIALTPNPKLSQLPPPINTSASRRKSSTLNIDVDAVASSMLGSRRQSTISNLIVTSDLTSSSRKQSSVSYSSDILGQFGLPSIIKKESSVGSIQDGEQKDIKPNTKISFKEGQKSKKKEILKLENPAALKRKGRRKRKSRSKSKSSSPAAVRKAKPFLAKKPVKKVETEKKTAKKSELDLTKANEDIKSDENLKTLEVENWSSFGQLQGKISRRARESYRVRRQVAAHENCTHRASLSKLFVFQLKTRLSKTLLHKRISMLQLNVQVQRVSGTQTDPFGTDSDCSGFASVDCQTIREWTAQKAHDAIRSNDEQLAELISEIENARLQAQTDFKFAVVQMEQKLRQEHEIELRTIKEEKERQLEDINRVQNDKLLLAEQEKAQFKADLSNEITEQKVELLQLRDHLAEKEAQNQSMATDLAMHEKSVKYLSTENEVLKRDCKKLKLDLKDDKSNSKMLVLLKSRLEKIEEINEILLAEFKKIELEKNHLLEQVNQLTASKLIGHQTKRLQPSFKANQFGRELDEIRQKFGGLHIT
uniref:Uncharacterized protein n=1 Tax=Ditylenchus dipsaci TaxID=166011 RepID=A0A915CR99_9BILA